MDGLVVEEFDAQFTTVLLGQRLGRGNGGDDGRGDHGVHDAVVPGELLVLRVLLVAHGFLSSCPGRRGGVKWVVLWASQVQ